MTQTHPTQREAPTKAALQREEKQHEAVEYLKKRSGAFTLSRCAKALRIPVSTLYHWYYSGLSGDLEYAWFSQQVELHAKLNDKRSRLQKQTEEGFTLEEYQRREKQAEQRRKRPRPPSEVERARAQGVTCPCVRAGLEHCRIRRCPGLRG